MYHSDHGAAESSMLGDKFGDEPSLGPTFDHGDDGDSIWNFDSKVNQFIVPVNYALSVAISQCSVHMMALFSF